MKITGIMKVKNRIKIIMLTILLIGSSVYSEKLKLKNGNIYEGKIQRQEKDYIVFSLNKATLLLKSIQNIIHLEKGEIGEIKPQELHLVKFKNGSEFILYLEKLKNGNYLISGHEILPDNYEIKADSIQSIQKIGRARILLKGDTLINGQIVRKTKDKLFIDNILTQNYFTIIPKNKIIISKEETKRKVPAKHVYKNKKSKENSKEKKITNPIFDKVFFSVLYSKVSGNYASYLSNTMGGHFTYAYNLNRLLQVDSFFLPLVTANFSYIQGENNKASFSSYNFRGGLLWFYPVWKKKYGLLNLAVSFGGAMESWTILKSEFSNRPPVFAAKIFYEYNFSFVGIIAGGRLDYSYDPVSPFKSYGGFVGVSRRIIY